MIIFKKKSPLKIKLLLLFLFFLGINENTNNKFISINILNSIGSASNIVTFIGFPIFVFWCNKKLTYMLEVLKKEIKKNLVHIKFLEEKIKNLEQHEIKDVRIFEDVRALKEKLAHVNNESKIT